MIRKIFLSPLGYIIVAITNIIGFFFTPFMVCGRWNYVDRKLYKNIRVGSSTKFLVNKGVDIKDYCWIGQHCIIDGSFGVYIGEGVQISGLCGIFSHSSHNSLRIMGRKYIEVPYDKRLGYISGSVSIGDYSFLGVGCIILPGVTLGKGCIVGAGAVVNRSFPNHSIVAGVPARVIGSTLKYDAAINGFHTENK